MVQKVQKRGVLGSWVEAGTSHGEAEEPVKGWLNSKALVRAVKANDAAKDEPMKSPI